MRDCARTLLAAALCVVVWISAVWAQDADGPDYEEWRSVASRAEQAIETNRASEGAMDELRNQLVNWRSQFSAHSSQSNISTQTLQAQLDRLGPAPESGEPEDVAQERKSLEQQLSAAQAPARQAELAQAEANELIRGIDALLRDRQAEMLLEPGPIPLIPSLWPLAAVEVAKRRGHGRHPGLLIIDSPASEEVVNEDFEQMLDSVASATKDIGGIQIILGTIARTAVEAVVSKDHRLHAKGDEYLF